MIIITVNWFCFILGFLSCIVTSVVIGVIGYFVDINQKNKIFEEISKFEMDEK